METSSDPVKATLGIIGIGNTIAGDDGAGIMIVEHLQKDFHGRKDILFHTLKGDLFEMAELIDRALSFIFIDALAGDNPGEIKLIKDRASPPFAVSFHQTDINSVMHALESISFISPFPPWEVWGIVIDPSVKFGSGISLCVSRAMATLTEQISRTIRNQKIR
jgi:hydrogenase maturation protease